MVGIKVLPIHGDFAASMTKREPDSVAFAWTRVDEKIRSQSNLKLELEVEEIDMIVWQNDQLPTPHPPSRA